ncbi:16S rRNA (cytosine(967)-C(5))-methyltransferase RsmB [Neobacillus sp. PS3-40]|uniref:16S rRNA (cytosine(967)-C(5))-methyltransferase RsmB n=1 Tax=Neobacillus sp. PS3-40 TaxID=3070679 RepID=UPI0027E1CB8B|nr:16S rRNA (cytosine(967)-C(5))-methyltransferase RsmB [Neobacillus sp. PS3-40]WML43656.1 16S rRNA (cytosine(967)-C(5))-methyltransferase RsmB [Neobacillus sp. PS3-40]
MTKKKKNVRETAMDLLVTIEKNQSYSNLLLNHAIEKNQLPAKDIGLLTELTYGTLQRKMTLAFFIKPFLKKTSKIESWVMQLLMLTLYQMVYLDRIPDRAAIFEAVEIAKNRGHKGIASMVNGVLRSIQREGLPSLAEIADPVQRLAIETSHPEWIIKRWLEQYGYEKTKIMCEVNLTAPLQTARVNTTKTTREECVARLIEEGFSIEASPIIPEAIRALKGNLAHSTVYKEGLLSIQDESSMLVAYALDVTENDSVLDACAAPGGKSTHIAEKMNNTGEVISLDLHEHKVKLINENASRLGLANIQTKTMDSRSVGEHFKDDSFDKVLLDAPCSGLGVMRRKPDMKYTKKEQDLVQLSSIQQNLLKAVSPLVKKGGILVYSTCTVDKEENENTVRVFLSENPQYEGDPTFKERMPEAIQPFITGFELQIFPQDFGSDGFYIATFRKKV